MYKFLTKQTPRELSDLKFINQERKKKVEQLYIQVLK